MDQLFDPDKYNDYPEDSQWMVPERKCRLQVKRIMNSMTYAASGAMPQAQQTENAQRSIGVIYRQKKQDDEGCYPK